MKKDSSFHNLSFNNNFFKRIYLNKKRDEYYFSDKNTFSLFKLKIFLQKLLDLIKLSQIDIISIISKNSQPENKNSINSLKTNLINLKNNLKIILDNNINKKTIIEQKINTKKSPLINSIFGENENNKELFHLKILNFKIKNEIEYIEIIKLLKSKNIKDFKKYKTDLDDDFLEIYCNNKNDFLEVYELLHENLINIRKKI